MTDEMKVKGKIDKWSMEPKKDGGKFLKISVLGKTFNFFDIEFFEKNENKFKMGNEVEITYFDNTWTTGEGRTMVSHVVKDIIFTQVESAGTVKPLQEFAKASEQPKDEGGLENIMKECVKIAMDIQNTYDGFFSSEDVRTMADCMFQEACKRIRNA